MKGWREEVAVLRKYGTDNRRAKQTALSEAVINKGQKVKVKRSAHKKSNSIEMLGSGKGKNDDTRNNW